MRSLNYHPFFNQNLLVLIATKLKFQYQTHNFQNYKNNNKYILVKVNFYL